MYTILTYKSDLIIDVRSPEGLEMKIDQRNTTAKKKVAPKPTYLRALDADFHRTSACFALCYLHGSKWTPKLPS